MEFERVARRTRPGVTHRDGGRVARGATNRVTLIWLTAVAGVVVSLLSFSSPTSAQVPPSTVPAIPATGLLSRFVGYVDNTAGELLEGIEVRATTYGGAVAGTDTTDVDGEFQIDVTDTPPDGNGYLVTFSDPGGVYATEEAPDMFIQPGYDELIGMTMQVGGRIVGTVNDSATTLGIDGACGWIAGETTSTSNPCTDGLGAYDSGPLRPGTYTVGFGAPGYSYDSVEDVVVVAEESTEQDVVLTPSGGAPVGTGSISGTFVSSDGGSAVPACFTFYGPTHTTGCTADGTFDIGSLAPGSYSWFASGTDGEHLSAQTPCCTGISVASGPVDIGDLVLPLGGSVSGTVLGDDGVTPLEGVTVRTCTSIFGCLFDYPGRPFVTTTASDGTYRIPKLTTGSYFVAFTGPGVSGQWWDGSPLVDPTPTSAMSGMTTVAVVAGTATSGIDARLANFAAPTISGTVIDTTSLGGLDRATVRLFRSSDANVQIRTVPTAADGSFSFGEVEPGSYRVTATAIGYLSETYDDEILGGTYTDIVVGPGDTRDDIDFALESQGAIEGVVSGNLPATEWFNNTYCVSVTPVDGSFGPLTSCRALGSPYRVSKLPTGAYTVEVSSYDFNTMMFGPVSVVAGAAPATQDALLLRRPVISGAVTDTSGNPALGAAVCAEGSEGRFCDFSVGSGLYAVSVPPGDYVIEAGDAYSFGSQVRYVRQFFPGLSVRPAEPNVAVTADIEADFELVSNPRIVGTLTSGGVDLCDFTPSTFTTVTAVSSLGTTTTAYVSCLPGAEAASYSIVVSPGTYTLRFGDTWAGARFAVEYWSDQSNAADADPITLALDETFVADADLALKPTITGSVTSDASGAPPVTSGSVQVYDLAGSVVAGASIVAGQYEVFVAEGSYKLGFFATGHRTEYWDNEPTIAGADTITVAAGGATADAVLEQLVPITGTITSGDPAVVFAQGASVNVYDSAGNYVTGAYPWSINASSVSYTVYVRPGTYRLQFLAQGFATEWWNDQPTQATADGVVVGASGATANASMTPLLLRTVSGNVYSDASSLGLSGVTVRALFPSGSVAAATGTTGAGGAFSLKVQPGEYIIEFNGAASNHVREYYDNTRNFGTAAVVDVRASDQSVNASLTSGGSITGLVTRAATPLNTWVYAVDPVDGSFIESDYAVNGAYGISGLPSGEYKLQVYDSESFTWRYYGGASFASATVVEVVAGGTETADIDIADLGESISGYVLDAAASPLEGVRVTASGPVYREVTTDATGFYELTGLQNAPTFGYRVSYAGDGYVSEYYDDSLDAAGVDEVIINGSSVVLDDVVLAAAQAQVVGTVVEESSGDAVSDVCLDFYELTRFRYRTCVDSGGEYAIDLPVGSFEVRLSSEFSPARYVSEVEYDSTAPLVTLAGANTVDMDIAVGGRISGRVVQEGTSTGIPNIRVEVREPGALWPNESVWTDGSGYYTTDALVDDDYFVRFTNDSGRYIAEYYDDVLAPPGTAVTVSAAADVADVNAELSLGAVLSGVITAAVTGDAIANACVQVALAGLGSVIASGCSGSDGAYSTTGIPDGTHDVTVSASGYATTTTSVVIAGGDVVQNFELEAETATLSGFIFDTLGAPIALDACVRLFDSEGGADLGLEACSGENGRYEIGGLDPTRSYWAVVSVVGSTLAGSQTVYPSIAGTEVDFYLYDTATSISGRVYDSSTLISIGGACVGLFADEFAVAPLDSVCVGADGLYEFAGLVPDSYWLVFNAAGYEEFASGAAPATGAPAWVDGPLDRIVTVPEVPGSVSAVWSSTTRVMVSFVAPLSDGGSAITGYLAQCTSGDGGIARTRSGMSGPLEVTGLTAGKTYECRVRASNVVGSGAFSEFVAVAVPVTVPGVPGSVSAAWSSTTRVMVSFVAPLSDGGSAITGYLAQCTSTDGGVTRSGSGVSGPLTVTGLTAGKTYECRVRASNAVGNGAFSRPVSAMPSAPRSVSAVWSSATRVMVSFVAPLSDGGSAITGYLAQCTSGDGGVARTRSGVSGPLEVTGLTAGASYECRVRASNAVGNGAFSEFVTVTVPVTVPGVPGSVSAVWSSATRVMVSFVAPLSDGGSAITGYLAQCTSGDGGVARTRSGVSGPLEVTGLTAGASYECRVRASNAVGNGAFSGLVAVV